MGEQAPVKNFRGELKWFDATVTEKTATFLYKVLVGDQFRTGGATLFKCVKHKSNVQIAAHKFNENLSEKFWR